MCHKIKRDQFIIDKVIDRDFWEFQKLKQKNELQFISPSLRYKKLTELKVPYHLR
jgi:hypothetical protein